MACTLTMAVVQSSRYRKEYLTRGGKRLRSFCGQQTLQGLSSNPLVSDEKRVSLRSGYAEIYELRDPRMHQFARGKRLVREAGGDQVGADCAVFRPDYLKRDETIRGRIHGAKNGSVEMLGIMGDALEYLESTVAFAHAIVCPRAAGSPLRRDPNLGLPLRFSIHPGRLRQIPCRKCCGHPVEERIPASAFLRPNLARFRGDDFSP